MQTAIARDRPPRYGDTMHPGRRDLPVSMPQQQERLSTIAGDRPPRYGGPMQISAVIAGDRPPRYGGPMLSWSQY